MKTAKKNLDHMSHLPAFRAGFARRDITPKESVPLAGAGNTSHRMSKGVLSALSISFLALSDESGSTVLIGSCDLLVISSELARAVRTSVCERTGIPKERILISAIHTHNAPDQENLAEPSIQRYLPILQDVMIQTAQEAVFDLCASNVFIGKTETKGLNFIRHYTTECGIVKGDNFGDMIDSPYTGHTHQADPTLQVVLFQRASAKDIILVNWQVHPHRTSLLYGPYHYLISSDIIGVMRERVEKETGRKLIYFNGAAGNINPTSRIKEENITEDYLEHGEALSRYVLEALGNAKEAAAGPVCELSRTVVGEIDHHEDEKVPEAMIVLKEWSAHNDLKTAVPLANSFGINSPYHAECLVGKSTLPKTNDVEMHAVSFGDVAIVTAPYEMFDTNAVSIRAHSPFAMTIVASITNDHLGYVPSEEGFRSCCYESNACRFVKGSAELFELEYTDMLNELKKLSDEMEALQERAEDAVS